MGLEPIPIWTAFYFTTLCYHSTNKLFVCGLDYIIIILKFLQDMLRSIFIIFFFNAICFSCSQHKFQLRLLVYSLYTFMRIFCNVFMFTPNIRYDVLEVSSSLLLNLARYYPYTLLVSVFILLINLGVVYHCSKGNSPN